MLCHLSKPINFILSSDLCHASINFAVLPLPAQARRPARRVSAEKTKSLLWLHNQPARLLEGSGAHTWMTGISLLNTQENLVGTTALDLMMRSCRSSQT